MKHAVVTGAGSGIGAAVVQALLYAEYRVTLMGRRVSALQETAAGNINCQCVPCDVANEPSVAAAFEAAVSGFGSVSVLVNCAGQAPTAPFHKLTGAAWQKVIAVNLNGVFNCTQQVIAAMREQAGGRIINIASTAALKGYPYVSAYCAAKHGVLGLTRALALETAQQGITVNAICPGYTDTGIIRDAVSNIITKTGRSEEEAMQEFTRSNPQGRLIQPDEVAATVLWLCSDAARSITGEAISISGGETA
jgi:NAD(P)-dependent dehydrogenase (short-subunit alcohol dehydrogenase family)